eukprot:745950-Hanusia_phi.AAC.1
MSGWPGRGRGEELEEQMAAQRDESQQAGKRPTTEDHKVRLVTVMSLTVGSAHRRRMGLPLRPSSTPLASSSFIEIPSFEPETVASIAKRRMLRSAVLRRPHTTLGQYSREWKWKSTKEEKEDDGDEEEAERHAHSWVDSVEKSILKNSRAIKKIKEAYESTRSFRSHILAHLFSC